MDDLLHGIGDADTLHLVENEFVGLDNYIEVFTRDDCFQALKLSVYYMVGAFIQLALALFFGFELPTIDYSNIDNAASSAGDIATGLDDATKAAKDLKNATLGIDELNIISQDTGAGAGAGGSVGGGFDLPLELPEYDFLAGLDKDIDDLKQQLKDLLLHYVLPIGAGFAAWELSKKFLPELGTLKRLLGSLMVGVGLSLVIDSIDDIIVSGKLTWKNILKGAAGGAIAGGGVGLMLAKRMGLTWSQGMLVGAAVGLGIALVVEAITSEIVSGLDIGNSILGALGGAIAGGGIGAGIALKLGTSLVSGTAIGAVIGTGVILSVMGITSIFTEGLNLTNSIITTIGTAITGAGIGFLVGGPAGALIGLTIGATVGILISAFSTTFEQSEFDQTISDLRSRIKDSTEITEEINVRISNISTEIDEDALANLEVAKNLLNDIFVLNEKENLTSGELALITEKVELLNSLGLENLHIDLDPEGKIVQTKEDLQGVIDNLYKQYQLEAAKDALVEAYKEQYNALSDISSLHAPLRDREQRHSSCDRC